MTPSDFNNLVRQLPLLTKEQMTDMRRRLAFLIGGESVGQNEDWLLIGIFEVLRARGKGHTIPPGFTVKKSRSYHGFDTQADRVRQVLDEAVPNMTMTEQRGIGVLCARALADYIESWTKSDGSKHEIDLDKMLHNVGKIPNAVDFAYPGYLSSGMLGMLVRRKSVRQQ